MKNILILLLGLMALPLTAQRLDYWTDGPDTSSTTVVYLTGGVEMKRAFNYDARIFVDVVSDTATVKLECKPVGGASWYVLKEWSGIKADDYLSYSGYVLGGTLRVSVLSTGAGSTGGTAWVSINPQYPGAGRTLEYWTDGPDTSATTAVTLAGGSSYKHDLYYDMGVLVDVVSDTATLYVDVLPFGGATWIPFDTVANIMADTYYFYQGSAVGGKLRARCISTGTGSSACTVWTMYARKED